MILHPRSCTSPGGTISWYELNRDHRQFASPNSSAPAGSPAANAASCDPAHDVGYRPNRRGLHPRANGKFVRCRALDAPYNWKTGLTLLQRRGVGFLTTLGHRAGRPTRFQRAHPEPDARVEQHVATAEDGAFVEVDFGLLLIVEVSRGAVVSLELRPGRPLVCLITCHAFQYMATGAGL